MKPKSVLKEYRSRLIRQTFVQVTGVVGLVVTAALGIFFSGVFVEWAVYLIILVAGLVAGSYSDNITITDPNAENSPQTATGSVRYDPRE